MTTVSPDQQTASPGQQAARAAGTDGFAVGGFVCSLVGLSLVGLALSIVGLGRVRRTRRGGRGLAVAGTVIGALGSLAWVAAIVVLGSALARAATPVRDADGTITRSGVSSLSSVRSGDCLLDAPTAGVPLVVSLVPCSQPHRAQAYAAFALPPSAVYPGVQTIRNQAQAQCAARASMSNAARTRFGLTYLYPQANGWAAGDHKITCMVTTSTSETSALTP